MFVIVASTFAAQRKAYYSLRRSYIALARGLPWVALTYLVFYDGDVLWFSLNLPGSNEPARRWVVGLVRTVIAIWGTTWAYFAHHTMNDVVGRPYPEF